MFSILQKIRNKSDREKKNILVVSTIVAMVVIVLVWIALIRIYPKPQIDDSRNGVMVFKSIGEKITESVNGIGDTIGEARSAMGI